MDREVFKKIVGLTFKKGKEDHPEIDSKTELSKRIVGHSVFNNTLGDKSLLNYFNYYFFDIGKEVKPNPDTLDALLAYLNYQSYKQFIENSPKVDYETDIPFVSAKEEILDHEDERNSIVEDSEKSKERADGFIKALMVLAIVALVSIVAISFYSKDGKLTEEQPTQQGITINAEHIFVSDINRVFPDANTEYFNQKGQPIVWYTDYNGQREFYNTDGIHPVTQQHLQPVTKEIIKTVYVEKPTEHHSFNKKTKPSNKSSPLLVNSAVKNDPHKKQLSLFIVNEDYKLDTDAMSTVKKLLKEKEFTITAPLISKDKINENVISNLQSLNNDYFKHDLRKYADYLCVGSITYTYSENDRTKNLKTCKLSLDYSIISTDTGKEVDIYSKTVTGIGSSEQSSKQNTLYKITL
jgi:hypothetical protein